MRRVGELPGGHRDLVGELREPPLMRPEWVGVRFLVGQTATLQYGRRNDIHQVVRRRTESLLARLTALVAYRGRESGLGAIPHGDGPTQTRGQSGPGRGRGLWVGADPRDLCRVPAGSRASGPSRELRACPTNNAADARALRRDLAPNQWGHRQRGGSRFVERMLTVVATCRQQSRNVLDYLCSCFEAARSGRAVPSLLPVTSPKIKIKVA